MKYRRKILSAEIETYLKELVQKIASDKGFTVHLFEVGEGDHIQCFVSAPPKMSVTDIVKYLKGNFKSLPYWVIILEFDIMKQQKRIFRIKGIMSIFISDAYPWF